MKLRHLSTLLFGTPLAIDPVKLEGILQALGPKLDLDLEGALPAMGDPTERDPLTILNGVATLDVFGTLSQRTMPLAALSGLTSYAQITAELQRAVDDPNVKSVILRLDSPGGQVAGMYDAADAIAALGKVKPIVALAEDKALSAAYMLAAACKQVYVTQSGAMGSIGIVMAHTYDDGDDDGKKAKKVYIAKGARKLDGAAGPLVGSEAWKAVEDQVAQAYDLFVSKVAEFRGITQAVVRGTEAAVYTGSKAVSMGLADGIKSYAEVLALLMDPDGTKLLSAGIPPAPTPAPFGARAEASMDLQQAMAQLEAERKARLEAEGKVVDLSEKLEKQRTKKEKWKGEYEALAKKELEKEQAKTALAQGALELKSVADVIEKHRTRGALVPAMIPAVQKMAETGMAAAEIDKILSGYPEHPAFKAGSPVTSKPTIPSGVAGGGAEAEGADTYELDAVAQKIADSCGWDKKTLAKFHGLKQIRLTERGPQAIFVDPREVGKELPPTQALAAGERVLVKPMLKELGLLEEGR